MASLEGVKSGLKQGKNLIGGVGIGTAINVGFAYFDYRGRISSGQNPTAAAAFAGGNALLGAMMGPLPYIAVTNGYGLMKSGIQAYSNYYQSYNAYTRRMSRPFSHSFSHTDATYQAQMRGMQMLTGARGGIGAEAGMMAQLYGRR